MEKTISSAANPLFRQVLLLLEKSRERKKQGLFVLEGRRELSLARSAGYVIRTVFYDPDTCDSQTASLLSADAELVSLSTALFRKIAYRESTEGIIALVESRSLSLDNIKAGKDPLVLVLEGIEKPGNLGAILRTADAAAVDAVLICDPLADVYNPNCIRSSVGGVFTNQVAVCSSEEAISWCRDKELHVFVTHLDSASWYHNKDYTKASAIVMGTEATGVSEAWLKSGFDRIKIPMSGSTDSMNVSVSTAILLFEAKRQRNFQ